MSHALNLAISIPATPLLMGALAIAVIAVIVLFVRKTRGNAGDAWANAAAELAVDLVNDESELGPVARGYVNQHLITVEPATAKGRRKSTQYTVKFTAPEAPSFRLIKRDGHELPTINTGNPKFDTTVVVQTDEPGMFTDFVSASRRAAILRILSYWPDAMISNSDVRLVTAGIEDDGDTIVDAVCHLVATAETFDRATAAPAAPETPAAPQVQAPQVQAPMVDAPQVEAPVAVEAPVVAAPAAEAPALVPAMPAAAEADVLTEVRLDELTVLNDLFNTGLAPDQTTARFEQIYQGREVAWSGEVVRVGPPDDQGNQRIAALIGSADGQNPESGRVVALTAVGPDPVLTEGDVVSFSGSLVNLNAAQRLFHVS